MQEAMGRQIYYILLDFMYQGQFCNFIIFWNGQSIRSSFGLYFKFGYLVGLSSKSLSPSPSLIRVLRNPSSTRIRY